MLPDDGALEQYEPQYVAVDGTETRYFEVGDGPPLVLLHGGLVGGSACANAWGPVLSELGERFRVLAFDRIGCGLTGPPPTLEGFDVSDMAAHAHDFLDAVGVDRCHFVGSSFGAGVATIAALEEPDRVETLTLTNSATVSPSKGDPVHRRTLINRGLPPADGSVERERERFRYRLRTFSYTTDHIDDSYVDTVAKMTCTDGSRRILDAAKGDWGDAFNGSVRTAIADAHRSISTGDLSIPTLIVWGRNDVTVPLSAGEALFDLLGEHERAVEYLVFNQCGHLPYREYPRRFSSAVTNFLRLRGDDPLDPR